MILGLGLQVKFLLELGLGLVGMILRRGESCAVIRDASGRVRILLNFDKVGLGLGFTVYGVSQS